MPRTAREKHDHAIYHIMSRGNNREKIFFDEDDKVRYLDTVKRYQEKYKVVIYAYCLMDNHAHLLIYANGQDISKVMQGINLSYTLYINRKYERCGHLFQGRFKSVIAKREKDVTTESKYIHYNPVKASIVEKAAEYKWSSIGIYLGGKDIRSMVNADFVLQCYSSDKSKAREQYILDVDNCKDNIVSKIEEDEYVSSDIKVQPETTDMNRVLSKVAEYYNICVEEILQKGNKRNARAKQIAAYLISLKSKLEYREIGQRFGICASAVGHNIKKAIEYIMEDKLLSQQLGMLL